MATACDGCDETAAYRVEHTELSIQSCVLLLRRNCCERHGCEEDCCEGNAEKRTAAKGTTENGLLRRGPRRMDSAACGSFAVLLLRRNCCEKHCCEEDCCEGTLENGLRRTGCCEEDYGERTTEKGLLTTDGCERTLLHVAHLPYTLLRNGSMCTRKTPGLPGRSHGKHKTVRRHEKVSAVRRWTHASQRSLLLLSCFSLANAEMDTCKPALSLATLLQTRRWTYVNAEIDTCQRGDRHMPTRG